MTSRTCSTWPPRKWLRRLSRSSRTNTPTTLLDLTLSSNLLRPLISRSLRRFSNNRWPYLPLFNSSRFTSSLPHRCRLHMISSPRQWASSRSSNPQKNSSLLPCSNSSSPKISSISLPLLPSQSRPPRTTTKSRPCNTKSSSPHLSSLTISTVSPLRKSPTRPSPLQRPSTSLESCNKPPTCLLSTLHTTSRTTEAKTTSNSRFPLPPSTTTEM